ncbi:MAG: aminotransferase class I/II-fold pyridoxal phosphate-dependent enzyme [Planctomycetaceae bacterium]|jgi:pyridoxal phosphate-dependent aminotransferase EpsN|nr:aminotransferase class I/II-fold pyridoxal phosphate-dependent enzyme [Planctomycetaceae bacterium]
MPPNRIYLSSPHVISPKEREYLLDAFDSNWIAPFGPHVDAFERELAQKVGAKYAVALSSGTAAIHLGLKLLGVEAGDEVFVSSLTFSASANPIVYLGAKPVFIDSDRKTWNMNPQLLAEEIKICAKRNKLPKVILPINLYGQCVDWNPIIEICQTYEIPILEDAAEALGASYNGKNAGLFGTIGIFSFNGNKVITSGGGGMLVTDNEASAQKVRFWATQARDPAPYYQHSEIGYNYRMSNLCAAVGRGQLLTLEERVAKRRANYAYYKKKLGGLPGIEFIPEPSGFFSTHWLTALTIAPKKFGASREDVRLALDAENIEARPVWKPMHLQPVFADCRHCGGDVAESLFENGLCLPSGSNLTRDDLDRIIAVIVSQNIS